MGRIELAHDHGEILAILNDPEMADRITEDGQEFTFEYSTVEQMDSAGWLLSWEVEGKMAGFYWVHPFTHSVLQIHAHFPKQKRHLAKQSGAEMLKWLKVNTPSHYRRFIAMIPACYTDVIGFSTREGLAPAGKIERASYRGGQCYDLVVLGVERESI